jgi:Na+/proline symporter
MSGLDQDMMQKNLSLKNLHEAKKNFLSFSIAFVPVNFIFLCLGVLFVIYMNQMGIAIPTKTDQIYPLLATNYLSYSVAIFFILGIIASAFSSANSALIAMTTSFMVDIYGTKDKDERTLNRTRILVHTAMAALLIGIVILFNAFNDDSVVNAIFKFAGYTYGPLLGLFVVGMFTKWNIRDRLVPIIATLSIISTVLIDRFSVELLAGYKFGFEILLVNGALTILGLLLCRTKSNNTDKT